MDHKTESPISVEIKQEGPKPLLIDVLYHENKDFRDVLDRVLRSGNNIQYHEQKRTPEAIREAFGVIAAANGDLRSSTAEAIADGTHISNVRKDALERLRTELNTFMHITTDSTDPEIIAAVEMLNKNKALQAERRKYVKERLIRDVPSREKEGIRRMFLGIAAASALSSGFSLAGLEGGAFAAAGLTDDGLSYGSELIIKKTGHKALKIVVGGVSIIGAGIVDIRWVPALFAAATGPVGLIGACLVYALTATAGSIMLEAVDFAENAITIRKLDRKGKLPGDAPLSRELLMLRNTKGFQRALRSEKPTDLAAFIRERIKIQNKPENILQRIGRGIRRKEKPSFDETTLMSEVQQILGEEHGQSMLSASLEKMRLGEIFGRAWKETMSNPYRSWLFRGLGVSWGVAILSGLIGLLPGKGLVPLVAQTLEKAGGVVEHIVHSVTASIIGPLENVTAFVGSNVDARSYDRKRKRELKKRLAA